ncbi:hypothetical protein I316_03834 [Kwoniella heveanensis BCC8398]|uniref:Uncharacterized protein n=1 Tax=Kwoniella heveanensis BCC8398 TaxID=1296120 RepID=A0A1B9GTC3_9TREE|nr:hypothetical protein I316_03834 [Kwoniella heveanensis BCC8398]
MNRLTNAFSAAIPSSGSDTSSIQHSRDSPRISSPLDPSFHINSHSSGSAAPRPRSQDRRHIVQNLIYDDPRTIYHIPIAAPSSNASSSGAGGSAFGHYLNAGISRPGRPGLLRHMTDDGSGRSGSQVPTPRVRSESRSRERDRGVRVNLMSVSSNGGKRGWGMNSATGTTRLNGMAQGPDGKYAIGGGQYLRVMQIYDPSSGSSTPMFGQQEDPIKERPALARGNGGVTINEVVNLWKPSWPVSKGVNDVAWGVGAYETKIVTGTPSGNMMLFDVEKCKLEKDVSTGTFRPVTCVRLSPIASHGHIAMAGGTDGLVRIWDLRERDPANRKKSKVAAAVTSLCFSPDDPYQFVVGVEDGSIRRFDFRSPSRDVGKAFGAHGSKAVMDLKWKEKEDVEGNGGGWLASAGADKVVQIWDMAQSWEKAPTPLHTIHTSHPVRRIAWRPNHPTELLVVPLIQPLTSSDPGLSTNLASVSLAAPDPTPSTLEEDAHLEIWHVRRHYVAKYALPTQDGVAIDVSWSNGDDNLVACFQNGGFAQMEVKGKLGVGGLPLPLDQVPRQVVSWSPKGEFAYAIDRFKLGEIPFDDVKPEYASHWDKIGRSTPSISDPPYEPSQTLGFLPLRDSDETEFAYLANWYRVEGEIPEVICRWNRDIAMSCGREDDARLWAFLKGLIEEFVPHAAEGTFREDVFSSTIHGSARLPTPPNMSPRRTGTPLPPNDREDRVERPPSPIPLARINQALLEDEEDAMDDSSSSSSGSYSDSESASSSTRRTKSRFLAFAPPETTLRRLSEAAARRESVATIVPRSVSNSSALYSTIRPRSSSTSKDRKSSDSSDVANNTSSTEDRSGTLSTSTSKKSSLSKMTASRIMAMSDWPDPYGIEAEPTSTGYTSRTSTRAPPTPAHWEAGGGGKPLRASPLPLSALRHSLESGTRKSSTERNTGHGITAGTITPGRAHSGKEGIEVKGREERFEKAQWDEYKRRRVDGLMRWWEGCIDDGEMQLAATVAIVGSCVATFPADQTERLAHSYVDMLERHRLAAPASYIRLYANLPSLQIVPMTEGMTHRLHCQRCGKSTGELDDIGVEGKVFWWCKRCKNGAKSCAVCRRNVKGLWMGCRRCGHGGHQPCIRLYHSQAPLLPLRHARAQAYDQSSMNPLTRTHTGNHTFLSTAYTDTEIDTNTTTKGSDGHNDLVQEGFTVCPTGCGCKCRRVGADGVP